VIFLKVSIILPLRRLYFKVGIFNYLWNTLPQSVIDAKDVRQFEIRLDEYWEHQDVKFEYKASIQNKENTGTALTFF
jgi:hypothetical protein